MITKDKFFLIIMAIMAFCKGREEAFIKDGKVKVVGMDLISALMMKLRGRRPYLILATCSDKDAVISRQAMRKR